MYSAYHMNVEQLCNFHLLTLKSGASDDFILSGLSHIHFLYTETAEKNSIRTRFTDFFTFLKIVVQPMIVFFVFRLNRKTFSDLSTRSFYRRSHKILSSSLAGSFCSLALCFSGCFLWAKFYAVALEIQDCKKRENEPKHGVWSNENKKR